MKKISISLIVFSTFFTFSAPLMLSAYQPGDLIVCDGVQATPDTKVCDFSSLITLAQKVITIGVELSTLLTVTVCIITGFKLLTAGGDAGARKQIKDTFMKIVIGYGVIVTAWLLVYTITSVLLRPEFNTILGTPK